MPPYPDAQGREPRDEDDIARQTGWAAPKSYCAEGPSPASARPAIECEVHDGLAIVRGKGHAHYVTGASGRQMLILERRLGERIRINSTTEVVILGIDPEHIRIAIEAAPEET